MNRYFAAARLYRASDDHYWGMNFQCEAPSIEAVMPQLYAFSAALTLVGFGHLVVEEITTQKRRGVEYFDIKAYANNAEDFRNFVKGN